MIYLDCAATALHRPPSVSRAVYKAMQTMASPGRGGHAAAMIAAETVFSCRMELAELFHVPAPEQVVFTMNATHALNIAIADLVSAGDKVVVSGYEHNSVMRPLHGIGARVHVIRSALFEDDDLLSQFEKQLPNSKAAVCTAMSNVFGYITPIEEVAQLCQQYGVPLIVDASQLAGCGALDFRALGADYVAMPGHKGLLGPQGTGVLLCGRVASPFMSGGSGSESKRMYMPEFLPDRLEAGTHNVSGIAGLLEGVRYIRRVGTEQIALHERTRLEQFCRVVCEIDGVETFYCDRKSKQTGVVSIRHDKIDTERLAEALGNSGVAVRGGLHCAPVAHETVGTMESGTVRFSFSPFTTSYDVKRASEILKTCVNKLKT